MARRRINPADISAQSAVGKVRGSRRAALSALLAALALLALAPPALAQVSFSGPTNYPVGLTPYAAAVGDFNADSRDDLAVANALSDTVSAVSVLLARPNGFSYQANYPAGPPLSGSAPSSVVVGDFNADSHPDLAVASSGSGTVSVLLGRGDGGFGDPTTFPADEGPWSVAVGDFNADSRDDLAVANLYSNDVSVLLNNTTTCAGRAATSVGSGGADRLAGTRGSDVLAGGAGNDLARGGGGNDLICAGPGNDRVAGGQGNDRLLGGGGQDRLDGGARNDQLNGGGGRDLLNGGGGSDILNGGGGSDTLQGGPGRDRVDARDGAPDRVLCGDGADVVRADPSDHLIGCERVRR